MVHADGWLLARQKLPGLLRAARRGASGFGTSQWTFCMPTFATRTCSGIMQASGCCNPNCSTPSQTRSAAIRRLNRNTLGRLRRSTRVVASGDLEILAK